MTLAISYLHNTDIESSLDKVMGKELEHEYFQTNYRNSLSTRPIARLTSFFLMLRIGGMSGHGGDSKTNLIGVRIGRYFVSDKKTASM